jgi:hypothetical protein
MKAEEERIILMHQENDVLLFFRQLNETGKKAALCIIKELANGFPRQGKILQFPKKEES